MVDFVLCKHTKISISISKTIFLTCFAVAKVLLIVILQWQTPVFCRQNNFCRGGFVHGKTVFFHPVAKTCQPWFKVYNSIALRKCFKDQTQGKVTQRWKV